MSASVDDFSANGNAPFPEQPGKSQTVMNRNGGIVFRVDKVTGWIIIRHTFGYIKGLCVFLLKLGAEHPALNILSGSGVGDERLRGGNRRIDWEQDHWPRACRCLFHLMLLLIVRG